ncbi:hypothetical protein V6259_12805 [Marinomonas sp. TI.3.20]|uniref:hypothetical protein n=1 Tax=Marinomonas sp. TI.3.20 TaxID=3121296 RepID=UPI00311D68ED
MKHPHKSQFLFFAPVLASIGLMLPNAAISQETKTTLTAPSGQAISLEKNLSTISSPKANQAIEPDKDLDKKVAGGSAKTEEVDAKTYNARIALEKKLVRSYSLGYVSASRARSLQKADINVNAFLIGINDALENKGQASSTMALLAPNLTHEGVELPDLDKILKEENKEPVSK